MRRCVLLFVVFGSLTLIARAQTASSSQMSGCISRDPDGKLIFGSERTGQVYTLRGDSNFLQQHVNSLVSVAGEVFPGGGGGNRAVLNVDSLRVISESCSSVSPSGDRIAVEGKAGSVEKAVPDTTTASVAENTPGFQTESSVQQFAGGERATETSKAPAPLGPSFPDQAGQSQAAADTNAAAASRAELYPGGTLGVDIQTAPPSSVQAQRSQSRR